MAGSACNDRQPARQPARAQARRADDTVAEFVETIRRAEGNVTTLLVGISTIVSSW
jgi:hypothetical protein